ncbi:MAG: hypothetical protein JHC26_07420 [Thermofilum sp.]|jgi:hypothetical protein|uniref:CPBP family intramembrane glutamic endopeptidase n=1 Tax=Thermofilum sp. TaxID=1961369 RepID=UPI0025868A82|nr:CPBP family intramembrane glutamic endopeptidase [Thermofilum sp.]MCI4408906.1 hypothetical protein [Thermofilum sp.]
MIDASTVFQIMMLYVFLDLLPNIIVYKYWERLVKRGVPAVLPFSIFFSYQVTIPDVRNLVALLLETAILAPFTEESTFRVAPYIVAGQTFMFISSVAWGVVHTHKVITSNRHLDAKTLFNLSSIYAFAMALTGIYYAYLAAIMLLLPYIFHVIHNTIAVVNAYLQARPKKTAQKKYIKEAGGQKTSAQQQGEAVKEGGEGEEVTLVDVMNRRWGTYSLRRYTIGLRENEYVEVI